MARNLHQKPIYALKTTTNHVVAGRPETVQGDAKNRRSRTRVEVNVDPVPTEVWRLRQLGRQPNGQPLASLRLQLKNVAATIAFLQIDD